MTFRHLMSRCLLLVGLVVALTHASLAQAAPVHGVGWEATRHHASAPPSAPDEALLLPVAINPAMVNTCISCKMVSTILTTANKLASSLYSAVKDATRKALLPAAFVIWLLVAAGRLIGSPAGVDPAAFWKDFAGRVGWTIVASILLTNLLSDNVIWKFLIDPLFSATMEYGGAILTSAYNLATGMVSGLNFSSTCTPTNYGGGLVSDAVISQAVCVVNTMGDVSSMGILIGATLIESASSGSFLSFSFSLFTAGLIVVVIYGLLELMVPFLFIDSLMRLAIIGVILPLLIVAWVFPQTRNLVAAAMRMLVHSALTILFLCVILGICLTLMIVNLDDFVSAVTGSSSSGGYVDMLKQLDGSQGKLKAAFSFSSPTFWIFVATGILTLQMMMKASALASAFSNSGDGMDSGMRLGGLAATAGVGAVSRGILAATSSAASGGRYLRQRREHKQMLRALENNARD